MTIADALKKYTDIEIELLLGHLLQQSKEFLYLHPEYKLSSEESAELVQMSKLRESGVPTAYITRYKHFYGLNFKVSKNVLIPRPETEWIVDEALRITTKKQREPKRKVVRILDVGTGSGAIAVSLAFNTDPAKVEIFATDISDKALVVAKQNANAAKVKINFSKHDLLTGVNGKFDIIIANLPYVPASDYKKFFENLKHEPKLALTDGTDNFILIKKLIDQLPSRLNKDGFVLLEIDPLAVKPLTLQAKKSGKYKTIKVIPDLQKLQRFIVLH